MKQPLHRPREKNTPGRWGAVSTGGARHLPQRLQPAIGNRALKHVMRKHLLQAKLTVSDANDVYEQEADRVADAVLRMPRPAAGVIPAVTAQVRRACPGSEPELKRQPVEQEEEEAVQAKPLAPGALVQRQVLEEEEEPVQAKADPEGRHTVSPEVEGAIQSLPGRGHPLPDSVRSFMEPRFNADFRAVRVHTDAHAQGLARAVSAQAFTVGRDVVFGAGQFAPETERGRHLLAHELTHVVQQGVTGRRSGQVGRLTTCQRQGNDAPAEPAPEPTVTLGPNADVRASDITKLKALLKAAGLNSATITSGKRNATDQARVMYDNIESKGEANQKVLYGPSGDKVIDVYTAEKANDKTPDEIRAAMKAKIDELGAANVSNHCKYGAIDVSPQSLSDTAAFVTALNTAKAEGSIKDYIPPPTDPAYHIEID